MNVSLDTLLRALADEDRRLLLSVLHRRRSLTLVELADELATVDHRPSFDDPSVAVERSYLDLYHRHVPVLAGAELVRYDRRTRHVEVTDLGLGVVDEVQHRLSAAIE